MLQRMFSIFRIMPMIIIVAFAVAFASDFARAQTPTPTSSAAGAGKEKNRDATADQNIAAGLSGFTPEREAAARVFVQRHHPELAVMLESLAPMNLDAYRNAIMDLYRTSESLTALAEKDPKRYDVALATWKARSQVELLAARYAAAPSPGLETELRDALTRQIDVDLQRQKSEIEQVEIRLRKLKDHLARQTELRDRMVVTRLGKLIERGETVRKSVRERANAKAKPNTKAKVQESLKKSEKDKGAGKTQGKAWPPTSPTTSTPTRAALKGRL